VPEPVFNATVEVDQSEYTPPDAACAEGRVLPNVEIDEDARIERCRSCQARVWWGKTAAGKSNPFDVVDGKRTAVTHFSTCRDARDWSKR
jgi:hypothetical protein